MKILGIDPGLDGAVGWIDDEGAGACPMPILDGRPDLLILKRILDEHKGSRVTIEEPCGMPGQSSSATFTTGRNYGILIGALLAWGIPFQAVRPNTWKGALGLNKGSKGEPKKAKKDRSIALAQQLFPDVDLMRTSACTTYHDGMAEALLLCEYGRRLAPLGEV